MKESATTLMLIVGLILIWVGGYGVGRGDVDYFITLDHNNVIIENERGEVFYYNDADSVSAHINRVNL